MKSACFLYNKVAHAVFIIKEMGTLAVLKKFILKLVYSIDNTAVGLPIYMLGYGSLLRPHQSIC